jgi:hypothetical protein
MDTKNIIATLSQSLLDEVKKIMKKEKEDKSEKGEKNDADEKGEHCSEALKGDQHKIDANKNGKVDSHDFHLLRKKKKGVAETYTTLNTGEDISEEEVEEAVTEEEQIDELSKATLGSYVKKAATSAANKGMEHGTKKAERDEVDRMTNRHMSFGDKDKIHQTMKTTNRDVEAPREKAGKRIAGINMAVKKLTKEDTEVELTQEEIEKIEATLADLDEGRGRPPKEGSDAWKKRQQAGAAEQDEPRQHPIQQLERIKRDMRGGADFKHKDGSTHHVTGAQAATILTKYHGLRPAEKEAMQKEIHANHAGFKKHL